MTINIKYRDKIKVFMEDDPFFAAVSTPAEVKPAIASAPITAAKKVVSENSGKDFGKLKERKFEKNGKEGNRRQDHTKNGRERKTHEREKDERRHSDMKRRKDHEEQREIRRPQPPPHHEKRPHWVDPKFRPPSMLNDVAFPKQIKINPNTPPGSFKIFSSNIPEHIVHAELYD